MSTVRFIIPYRFTVYVCEYNVRVYSPLFSTVRTVRFIKFYRFQMYTYECKYIYVYLVSSFQILEKILQNRVTLCPPAKKIDFFRQNVKHIQHALKSFFIKQFFYLVIPS